MIRLLLGLVKPDGGMISLKDQNQRLEVSEQTRKNFIYVPQGNTLFGMSIRENLLIGNPDSTEEDLKKVLNIAVADFVYDLPEGIDTQLGENGLGVSEGQAQRIAIARALLRPGSILLLDEATSALDIDTETKFIARLKNEMSDKTVIFITHHKSIADICDNVYKI